MNKLQRDELGAIDREVFDWAKQGFVDIAMIVAEDQEFHADKPILSADDPIHINVQDMRTQGHDLFVTLKSGDILHYRMTVERL